jgi:exosortase/archaeosortase family protein
MGINYFTFNQWFMGHTQETISALNDKIVALVYFLVLPAIGCWTSWKWLIHRGVNSPEEVVAPVALICVLTYWAITKYLRDKQFHRVKWQAITCSLILYGAATVLEAPALVKCAIALMLLASTIYWLTFGQGFSFAFIGLILLALPIVPSLQFYLGYPARLISAILTVPLLQLQGLAVTRSGTYLVWNGEMIQFDAPCSGVTMLWAGLSLSFFMSFLYRFNWKQTGIVALIACVMVLFGNVLRAASLFYLETKQVAFDATLLNNTAKFSELLHYGVGIISFVLIAILIIAFSTKILGQGKPSIP